MPTIKFSMVGSFHEAGTIREEMSIIIIITMAIPRMILKEAPTFLTFPFEQDVRNHKATQFTL